MVWYTYEMPPIDVGWELLHTVKEVAKQFGAREAAAASEGRPPAHPFFFHTLAEFLTAWESAQEAARTNGWDGDFREEPRVLVLPDETSFRLGFVFKQDNNGTTYVVSPVELPYLLDF